MLFSILAEPESFKDAEKYLLAMKKEIKAHEEKHDIRVNTVTKR